MDRLKFKKAHLYFESLKFNDYGEFTSLKSLPENWLGNEKNFCTKLYTNFKNKPEIFWFQFVHVVSVLDFSKARISPSGRHIPWLVWLGALSAEMK